MNRERLPDLWQEERESYPLEWLYAVGKLAIMEDIEEFDTINEWIASAYQNGQYALLPSLKFHNSMYQFSKGQ